MLEDGGEDSLEDKALKANADDIAPFGDVEESDQNEVFEENVVVEEAVQVERTAAEMLPMHK
jgi:hypothetical protein